MDAKLKNKILHVTGLPGSGKTTIANLLGAKLKSSYGVSVEVLDGFATRNDFFPELGYSPPERRENVHRVHRLARMLVKHGVVPVLSLLSPIDSHRVEVLSEAERSDMEVIFVLLQARDEVLHERMRKRGRIEVGCSYDAPTHPVVLVDTSDRTEEETVRFILELLGGERF